MKVNLFILLPFIFAVILISCGDLTDNEPKTGNDKATLDKYEKVNNWIMDNMEYYYLWNAELPGRGGLNFKQDPYDFYKSIKSSKDRFSSIEGTHQNVPKSIKADASSQDIGFEFFPGKYSDSNEYFLIIGYVKPNTYAEKMGLKRGQIIEKVDGKALNSSNWFEVLYQGKTSYKINTRDLATNKIMSNLELKPTPSYKENPIYLDSVYTINNRKVGYLVYNSYDAGGEADLPYDVQMAGILNNFKSKGIRDLIIDLRYNGGGLVRSARYLTSALVPNRSTKNIFEIKRYNNKIQKEIDALPDTDPKKVSMVYEFFTDDISNSNGKILFKDIPRLGDQLDNVYFIVSNYTASASEMTINTLKPYMNEGSKNVVLVGRKTVGKNVGSFPLYKDEDVDNTYVIWPISFQSYNKNRESNYAEGFAPDKIVDEFEYLSKGWENIGDTQEIMLATALDRLLGTNFSQGTTRSSKSLTIYGASFEQKTLQGMIIENPGNINSFNR